MGVIVAGDACGFLAIGQSDCEFQTWDCFHCGISFDFSIYRNQKEVKR